MCGMLSIMVGIPGVLTGFLISKNAGLILLGVAALFGLFGVGRLTFGKKLSGREVFVKCFSLPCTSLPWAPEKKYTLHTAAMSLSS